MRRITLGFNCPGTWKLLEPLDFSNTEWQQKAAGSTAFCCWSLTGHRRRGPPPCHNDVIACSARLLSHDNWPAVRCFVHILGSSLELAQRSGLAVSHLQLLTFLVDSVALVPCHFCPNPSLERLSSPLGLLLPWLLLAAAVPQVLPLWLLSQCPLHVPC